jgi:hypothetical protein
VTARQASETEERWDKEFDPTGLAEHLAAAGQRGEAPTADWLPIDIPPGKEDTVTRQLAVRINAARSNMERLEA